jgi:hypothetical protein
MTTPVKENALTLGNYQILMERVVPENSGSRLFGLVEFLCPMIFWMARRPTISNHLKNTSGLRPDTWDIPTYLAFRSDLLQQLSDLERSLRFTQTLARMTGMIDMIRPFRPALDNIVEHLLAAKELKDQSSDLSRREFGRVLENFEAARQKALA